VRRAEKILRARHRRAQGRPAYMYRNGFDVRADPRRFRRMMYRDINRERRRWTWGGKIYTPEQREAILAAVADTRRINKRTLLTAICHP
jgi:hypothetical protein